MLYGPINPVSVYEQSIKYLGEGEDHKAMCNRIADTLADNEPHRRDIFMSLLHMNFLPAGRVQRAVGSPLGVTPYNCFVTGVIEDDSECIFDRVKEAFLTWRTGGGMGFDFSRLRPRGAIIKSVGAGSSGAVSFIRPFNSACETSRSAGGRRGAAMGVLRIDHPDIVEFITCKQDQTTLNGFNLSVGVTDKFMNAVCDDDMFDLVHGGKTYETISARGLWDLLMRATWDWAEPGILFLDTINLMNNLWYCETLDATNPCGEQPLPANGACLLGSFLLTNYIRKNGKMYFDFEAFKADIPGVVRMMDNVINGALYPLPAQEDEAKAKRRMGLGVTGAANAIESLGFPYGSEGYIDLQNEILITLRDGCYRASIDLAKEKGAFPLFDAHKYCSGEFIKTLPQDIQDDIYKYGIRNSHLTSLAPTGSISLAANNCSGSIEPVIFLEQDRDIIETDGVTKRTERIKDYGLETWGTVGRTSETVTPEEHIRVLTEAQALVDSAVSKTCNIGDSITFDEFKDVYMNAWQGGAKGCTTFRAAGKRFGVIRKAESTDDQSSCSIDVETGVRNCE